LSFISIRSQSAVLGLLEETIQGRATIRLYGQEAWWQGQAHAKLLRFFEARLPTAALSASWLTLYVGAMGSLLLLIIAMCIVAARADMYSATAGFLLWCSITLRNSLSLLVRDSWEAEQMISSFGKLQDFASLAPEAGLEVDDVPSPPEGLGEEKEPLLGGKEDWPQVGSAVIFQNVDLRYPEQPVSALQGMSLRLEGHCGVVGRSGAGKSSLLAALLRLVELRAGRVLVDGRDIAHVNAATLRQVYNVIPQEAVVFQGSLRFNLDPTSEHSDVALTDALTRASLPHLVASLDVDSLGDLSAGERSLLCLARALLRTKSPVVLLDEASSALDASTDLLIQRTIRKSFASNTVVMIAHRLETVIDVDTIVVVAEGRVVESGPPEDLLRDPLSAFSRLVEEVGETARLNLRGQTPQQKQQNQEQRV
jgi:ABC-type multidrug transport system fused ATPase/permease subunit